MKTKELVRRIMTKDTCYGMYDAETPSNEELIDYFSLMVEEHMMEFHKKQTIVDKENEAIQKEKDKQWWNK